MSIRSFFTQNLSRNPNRTLFLFRSKDGTIHERSYAEAAVRVRQISEFAIQKLHLAPRKNNVAIILDNSPTWIEIYLGHNAVAIPVVPLDPKLRPEEISYIVSDAAVNVIYTDCHHISVLSEIVPQLPNLQAIVFVDGAQQKIPEAIDGRPCYDLTLLMAEVAGAASGEKAVFDQISVAEEDIASIIYTSGTTGHPKGAMLTNANFCFDVDSSIELFSNINISSHDDFFVVLPLFHSFSFNTNFIVPLRIGAGIQFCTSLRSIADDMRTFRPSIFMAVPLLVEKIHGKILDGIQKSKVARLLKKVGLSRIIIAGIRKNLGGRLRLFVVGGAPCSAKLLTDMRKLGMPIVEGYGLTEASPIVSIRPYNDTHVGSIGVPIPGIEVKLSDCNDAGVGELMVRGANVMKGYLNKPEETAETLDSDGWLHTGDLASQDSDGFLTIRGRKKALIVNREGKNIYPEEVELCIAHDPHILEVLVLGYTEGGEVGEKIGAIIVPNLDLYKRENKGSEPKWDAVEASVRRVVIAQCEHLAEYKMPRKVVVYKDPLVRTSAGKIRRFTYRDSLNV